MESEVGVTRRASKRGENEPPRKVKKEDLNEEKEESLNRVHSH